MLVNGKKKESEVLRASRSHENLRSGELAKQAGISPDTLRHYERKGLLPAPRRTANGYRLYSADALHRVRIIRSALAVGFTIQELGGIFKIRNSGGSPCEEVLKIARSKVLQLEERMKQLHDAKRDLQKCVREWKDMLSHTEKGKRAGLLENLDRSSSSQRPSPMLPPGLNKSRRTKDA